MYLRVLTSTTITSHLIVVIWSSHCFRTRSNGEYLFLRWSDISGINAARVGSNRLYNPSSFFSLLSSTANNIRTWQLYMINNDNNNIIRSSVENETAAVTGLYTDTDDVSWQRGRKRYNDACTLRFYKQI